ncbi:arsenate reductase (glutaredoxin) [soil metagenome]
MATLFRENNIDFEKVNYFNESLSEEKLRALLKKANLAPSEVLRKSEKIYKELNLSKETDADKLIKLMVEHPNLLQRPIVEVGSRAILARPIEKALELLNL